MNTIIIPQKATLVEVGPRDGFQNVKTTIPTTAKVAIIRQMITAGVREMEITSFVNPKWVPQMADAAEVTKQVLAFAPKDFRAIALAPNRRGVENAMKAGLNNVTYVVSASESHNKNNVNKTIETSLQEIEEIKKDYPDLNLRISISVVFGCPFEGEVPPDQVMKIISRLYALNIREIVLCDTIGVANPLQVSRLLTRIQSSYSQLDLGLHFHDTRGMGLANIYAGLQAGIDTYETSGGGLGGCPFAPGSAGNTATEDMLNMWQELGIKTGIDLDEYLKAVQLIKEKVDGPVTGRIANICQEA
jgi:hydroxymethylglutaryl-CoA lyase